LKKWDVLDLGFSVGGIMMQVGLDVFGQYHQALSPSAKSSF